MKNVLKFSLPFLAFCLLAIACKKEDCPEPSTQNTELVKKLVNDFGTGNIAGFLDGCASDCVFDLTGNLILNPGKVYNGHNGFNTFLGELSAKGQPTALSPEEFYEIGDAVTVRGKIEFKDFATNQTCKVNFIQLWKFKDGKVILLKEDHDSRVCQ